MKKQLVAIAVAAAVAAPAMAQNVSLYGQMAVGLVQNDADGTASDTSKMTGSDRRGTALFGLKGSEDLGGGLKVGFVLESGLNTEDGSQSTAGTFDRKSYIEVSSAKLGTVQVGRIYTATESAEGYSGMGWNLFDADTTEKAGGKLANSIGYTTPELIKGLTLTANHTNSEQALDAHEYGYGAKYVTGNLTLQYAYDVQNINDMAETSNESTKVLNVGYNFGVVEARVTHMRSTDENSAKYKYTRVGVDYPMGGGVKLTGMYDKADGDGSTTNDWTGYGVAVQKALSKRTTVWAALRDKDVAGGSTSDVTITAFGIDHAF
jgi:predicted porin